MTDVKIQMSNHFNCHNPNTIQQLLRSSITKLKGISDAPGLDLEWLLLTVVKREDSSWLYAHGDKELTDEQREEYERLVARRASGEPLAYIIGEWEFYGRLFYVNKDVLVPRPSTEDLVETALAYLEEKMRSLTCGGSPTTDRAGRPYVIADVGTGSGCIVISLALELFNTKYQIPDARYQFYATDISRAALRVARENAERHGVSDKITFLEGDMLDPLNDRQVDLIVSNPPYLLSSTLDKRELEPLPADERGAGGKAETAGLRFEPRLALDGGEDGNVFIEKIKAAGVPAVVEVQGGAVRCFNRDRQLA